MPRTISFTAYKFSELSDAAKAKARDWFREGRMQFDPDLEDFYTIAGHLGITLKNREPQYSGFWSQGDGASFTGSYDRAELNVAALKAYAPIDEKLHAIADRFAALPFDRASVSRFSGAHYVHECTMDIEPEYDDEDAPALAEVDWKAAREVFRDLARWLYRSLEAEWDYRNSDEAVDQDIEANEYDFTADGKRCVALN